MSSVLPLPEALSAPAVNQPAAAARGLRITHVITRFPAGGAEENTLLSCNWFAERGHQVSLVYGAESNPYMVGRIHPKIHKVQLPSLLRRVSPSNDLRALFGLARILRRLQPDIVHTHESKAGILGRLAAVGMQSKVIHGIHILPFVAVGHTERIVYLALERLAARVTDAFVSVSDGMRSTALEAGLGTPNQHFVVSSGMDLAAFKKAGEARPPGVRGERGIVVYVANYEARKQHRELIRAVAGDVEFKRKARLVLAGTGHLEAELKQLAADCNVSDCVSVVGFVQNPAALIGEADVCIYCSTREGLPRAVVQYCAVGRPIVAFDLPGIEAIIKDGDNGVICPQGDFGRLLKSVVSLVDNPEDLGRMSERSNTMDLTAWDVDQMCMSLDQIYRKVVTNDARVS